VFPEITTSPEGAPNVIEVLKLPVAFTGTVAVAVSDPMVPLLYVTVIDLTFHTAYKVTSEAVVYPSATADPVVVVDQPANVYPVFTNVPTVGSVIAVPPDV
jgi:hypothetical protein